MTRTIVSRSLPLFLLAIIATPAAARVHTEVADVAPVPQRIDGNTKISPDVLTATQIARAGNPSVIGVFNVCIDSAGNVADISVLRSTEFSSYDAKIQREIRGWRYQPVTLDGKPSPACTVVTLVYQQK
jgi:TonB family protein